MRGGKGKARALGGTPSLHVPPTARHQESWVCLRPQSPSSGWIEQVTEWHSYTNLPHERSFSKFCVNKAKFKLAATTEITGSCDSAGFFNF